MQRGPRDPGGVVVLDQEQAGRPQQRAQLDRAFRADRGPGRVLRPWRHDQGARPAPYRGAQRVRQRAGLVDRDRQGAQPERGDEVEQVRVPGVLDRDGVAGAQVGLEHPFDRVQGSRGDGEVAGRHALGRERLPAALGQSGRYHRHAVPLRPLVRPRGRGQRGPQVGQQVGGRVAVGQVACVRGHDAPGFGARRHGRPGADPGAAPPVGRDDPPVAQRPVRGGRRVGSHPELGGQVTNGWQQGVGRQLAAGDGALDRLGDLLGRASLERILCWHIHNFVPVQKCHARGRGGAYPRR